MERVHSAFIEDEMEQSYIDYALSVIRGRAIPDVRDGLKPVQRRILYAMRGLGLQPGKQYRKSARIVGETMGKYHPHGDLAVYEAMAGLAQTYTTRYPLVDGQGNFGSIDGDSPAAMRYTEARLAPVAMEFLQELNEQTVDFMPNFDDSIEEPEVLPVRLPHTLVNGAWGISVGMTTQIPPHNLRELLKATLHLMDNPEATADELMQFVPGPDFPTGGFLVGGQGIADAYRTGEGRLRVRARAFIEDDQIVITEIPYQVRKSTILESIAAKVKSSELEGVSDLRDESDREGLRVVVELKRDAAPQRVLQRLLKLTALERTYACHFLVIQGGSPKTLSLPQMLAAFLSFRRSVVRRRTEYRLRMARERAHILEGFQIALDRMDEVIEIIRSSGNPDEALALLSAEIGLTDKQAEAVLRMRLSQLTKMERHKIDEELKELRVKIAEYEAILGDPAKLDDVIREELTEIADNYGDDRRTTIVSESDELNAEDIEEPKRDIFLCITGRGYVNASDCEEFRVQGRGGKGVKGIRTKDSDSLQEMLYANTYQDLLVFTDRARVFKLPAARLSVGQRASVGKNLRHFLEMDQDEEIRSVLPVEDFGRGCALLATRNGVVNRNALADYGNAHSKGILAYNIAEDDRLVGAHITGGEGQLILASGGGQVNRFAESQVRLTRRPSMGVRGMRLEDDDAVVATVWLPPDLGEEYRLLLVTQNGYGKRLNPAELTPRNRGGKGLIGIKLDKRTGPLVSMELVGEGAEVLVSTKAGQVIRFQADQVSTLSRYARGVRLIRVDENDRAVSTVVV
ncbi:MAG: DNA gyrase subunit A [Candidatus Bipolaricaulota bacterium]